MTSWSASTASRPVLPRRCAPPFGRQAGRRGPVTVRRAGSEVTVAPRAADTRGVATIGVVMSGRYRLPIPVTIHAGAVGGPSAGLMFSLGIYDVPHRGNLTGGASIAGTGTIADDGAVGPIGGIRQKVVGAREAGAAWFLTRPTTVPTSRGTCPQVCTWSRSRPSATRSKAVESIAAGSTDTLSSCGFGAPDDSLDERREQPGHEAGAMSRPLATRSSRSWSRRRSRHDERPSRVTATTRRTSSDPGGPRGR